jgi:hypothetical protein
MMMVMVMVMMMVVSHPEQCKRQHQHKPQRTERSNRQQRRLISAHQHW